jgi:hypothetical protein
VSELTRYFAGRETDARILQYIIVDNTKEIVGNDLVWCAATDQPQLTYHSGTSTIARF